METRCLKSADALACYAGVPDIFEQMRITPHLKPCWLSRNEKYNTVGWADERGCKRCKHAKKD